MTSIAIDRLDGLSSSTAVKGPCKAGTTGNATLSGEQTIDGVACVTGDRVLVMAQTDATANGIYVVDTGTWARSKDFSRSRDIRKGTQVYVVSGTTNEGWYGITTADPISLDEDEIEFEASARGPQGDPTPPIDPGDTVTETGAFTFNVDDHLYAMVRFDSSTQAQVTLPADADVGAGFQLVQIGAGRAHFVPDTGASLRNELDYVRTRRQWSVVGVFVESNSGGNAANWVLFGSTGQ